VRPISLADRGREVVDIQTRLRALGFFLGREGADGHFGPHTQTAIQEFQQRRLLLADGVVGEHTWTELVEAGHELGERLLYLRIPPLRGDDVLHLQRRLNELGFDSGPENGIFGAVTETALTEFQRNSGLNVDGIMGEATLAHLRRVGMMGGAAAAHTIPDRMDGYVRRNDMRGLRVSLDPAHGGTDPGGVGQGGLTEKDCNLALARALAGLLEAQGAEVLLTRTGDRTLGLLERSRKARAWQPEVHVCLHHNSLPSRAAAGSATYYFANGAYYSEAGRRLAGYLVRALVEELGTADLHTHGRNYYCLRESDCLAVMVEPAFVTNEHDLALLVAPDGFEREARALCRGLLAYLARGWSADPPLPRPLSVSAPESC